MIAKMKKVTLLVSSSEREEAVKRLRKLGVIHVQGGQITDSADVEDIQHQLIELKQAIQIASVHEKMQGVEKKEIIRWDIQEIIALDKDKHTLQGLAEELKEKKEFYRIWGDLSKKTIEALEKNGVYVKLYQCALNVLKKERDDEESTVHFVCKERNHAFVALISRSKDAFLEGHEHRVPDISHEEVLREMKVVENKIAKLDEELSELSACKHILVEQEKQLMKRLEFYQVKDGMAQETGFCYLQGYCPQEFVWIFEFTPARALL